MPSPALDVQAAVIKEKGGPFRMRTVSLQVRPGESLAVLGTGSVGLAAVMAAKVAGATTVVAVDVNETRQALAADLGATHAVNARTDDVADRLRQIRPGGFDYVLEITARPQLLALAVELLAPMGTALADGRWAGFALRRVHRGGTVQALVPSGAGLVARTNVAIPPNRASSRSRPYASAKSVAEVQLTAHPWRRSRPAGSSR